MYDLPNFKNHFNGHSQMTMEKGQFFPSKQDLNRRCLRHGGSMKKFKTSVLAFAIITFLTLNAYSALHPIDNVSGGNNSFEVLHSSIFVGNEHQRVIITRPFAKGPFPAMLFIGGLGCYSLDFSKPGPHIESYKKIIEFVASQGFVTVRIEKTGMGESTGTPCMEQSFAREVQGYLKGLEALKEYSYVNKDKILLFGHSIGGIIAPMIASESTVKSIVTVGTLTEKWVDYDKSNTRRQLYLAGLSVDVVQQEMQIRELVSQELLVNKKTPAEILSLYPHLGPYLELPAHYTYMQQLADLDMSSYWKKFKGQGVLLLGESDFIGSQWKESENFVAVLNQQRPVALQLQKVPKMDHFFLNAESFFESFHQMTNFGKPLFFQENFLILLKNQLEQVK